MDHRGQKQHYTVPFLGQERKSLYPGKSKFFNMRPIQLRFLLDGLLWKQGGRLEAAQVGPVSYLDSSIIPLPSARYLGCCYMKDTLLLFITSFKHTCSTSQHILQNSTSIMFVEWLWAQKLPLTVGWCFIHAAHMEEPRFFQGNAALDITKILWESGWPDAKSRAGRRNGVLRGLLLQ